MLACALLMLVSAELPLPKDLYALACAQCHGRDLSGRSAESVRLPGPSLLDPKRRASWKTESLATQILEGRGAMPAHRAKLKPEQAQALAEWLMERAQPKPKDPIPNKQLK